MWVRQRDYRVLGRRLAALRKKTNCTQEELAARLGKAQSFVSAYENGQRRLDLLEFLRVVEALGLKPVPAFKDVIAAR